MGNVYLLTVPLAYDEIVIHQLGQSLQAHQEQCGLYDFIATVSMMCDALDPVAKLCTALQAKSLDFAEFTFIVDACITDLQAMVDSPDEATEYFKKWIRFCLLI